MIAALGNLLGGLAWMGSCPRCGRQHMSTHDRVLRSEHRTVDGKAHGYVCERCATPAEVSK